MSADKNTHHYSARLAWEGNRGDGTADYKTYGRQHRIRVTNKPDMVLSADTAFRGDGMLYNPEDLFVISLSSCHLLSYLALCARHKIIVLAYEDEASGTMTLNKEGGGKFDEVTLRPLVTIAEGCDEKLALELHDRSAKGCFIAASVGIPVKHEPIIRVDHNVKAQSKIEVRVGQ